VSGSEKKLTNMLLVHEESLSILQDPVTEKLNEDTYQSTKPKSLHGAFVDAHATLFYLLRKCEGPGCQRNALLGLAKKQLDYLELLHSCLSYRMSGELLRYPYGPKEERDIEIPKQCTTG
jgi:hypothetical protein